MITAITILVILTSCEKESPEPLPCDREQVGELTEWGEQVKAELTSLFLDIEDLSLCQVWSSDGQVRYWSGYNSNGADTREIQVDFLSAELILVYKQFVNGHWSSSLIRVPYDMVITTVLQFATHIDGGMVIRRSNNILIYMSDQFDPETYVDGVEAMAIPPAGLKVNREKTILQRNGSPAR
jgi:hypothetical protein